MKFIWTHHAIERIKQRRITQDVVESAISSPTAVKTIKQGKEYSKRIGKQTVFAIVKTSAQSECIIISAWINPPNPNTKDAKLQNRYHVMQQATPIKKIWLTLITQLGF